MSAILINQEIVHYEVLGRGRPIILLHSWVGSWRYWIPVMQGASVAYRTYAIDLWGFGDSNKDPARYSLAEQVQLLQAFLDQMGILRCALVGHGLGAILALLYTRDNPDAVDRVMAVGFPVDESRIHARLHNDAPADLADWLLSRLPSTEAARTDAPKADAQAIQTSLSSLQSVRLRDLWCASKTSCLQVHGQNDPAIQMPRDEDLADLPESNHAILFEQSGHFPMLDETSKFNRLMFDFLSLPSGESPRELQLKDEWKRRVR